MEPLTIIALSAGIAALVGALVSVFRTFTTTLHSHREIKRLRIEIRDREGALKEFDLPGEGAEPLSEAQIKELVSRLIEVEHGHAQAAKD